MNTDKRNHLKSLTEIANTYGTDKGTIGPSLGYGGHNYTDVYEAYLSQYRFQPIRLLEIGIGTRGPKWEARIVHGRNKAGGGSIKMWQEYFPNAQIVAIDINPAKHLNSDRIQTIELDQSDESEISAFLTTLTSKFDFIIDDGSHNPEHQQICFAMLFTGALRPGGYYFIEDLDNNGLGDGARGRHASKRVLATRKVLRSLAITGEFSKPNALLDISLLAKQIHSITFHAPIPRIVPMALLNILRGKRAVLVQFETGTERLCAIRKIDQ